MKLNKLFRKGTLAIVAALLGIGVIFYIFSKISLKEVLSTFASAKPVDILIYAIIQMAMLMLLTIRWRIIIASQGIKGTSIWKLNNFKWIGNSIGFITPSAKLGGEPVRAGLMSKTYNLPFHKALSSVVIDKTLEISLSLFFFIIGGTIMLLRYVVIQQLRDYIIALSVIFVIILFLFNYRVMRGKHFFHRAFEIIGIYKIKGMEKFRMKMMRFEKLIIKFYHKDRKHFFLAMLVSGLSWLLMFVEYWYAGQILGVNLSPLGIFFIFSFVGAAYILPVPMGLGALEAGQASIFLILGFSAPTGVALSLLVRLKDIILAVIGFIMLGYYGLKLKDVVKDTKYLDKEVDELKEDD